MRGSTTAIIKPDGTLIKGYSYDEFGNTQQNGGTSDFLNEVTFTGSVGDSSTGLQYMNARHYDPSTGRFLTQDSYTGNAYDPWTQHLYSYCGNNPVNMVDPTGHIVETVLDAASAAWSTTEMINNPSLENGLYLLWDIASIFLPFVPGSYVARGTKLLVEATTHVDEVVEVGTKIVDDVTKNVDNVAKNVDKASGKATDLVKVVPQKVIGHNPEYIELSKTLGTKPFSVPDRIWAAMTDTEKWAANKKSLDRAISKGSEFVLATPINKVKPRSFLRKEIDYLMSRGYKYSCGKLVK